MTDTSPKVLHLVTSNARRGAEVAAQSLVEQLGQLGISGSLRALTASATAETLSITVLGPGSRHPKTLRGVRHLAAEHDIVVAHGSDTLMTTALATVGLRSPFIYQMIGDPEVWGDVKFANLRIGSFLRRASGIVVLWPGAGDSVSAKYQVQRDRITVIGNARDANHFRPPSATDRTDARQSLGLTDATDRPVVAWIGALSEEKRPDLAVSAAEHLPGSTLLVAGDGPLRASVHDRARTSSANVRVLGPVEDVRRLLWAADLLLITSRTEGMPGVAIEASLCGTPIAAPAVGGLPDLLGRDSRSLFTVGDGGADEVSRIVASVNAVLHQNSGHVAVEPSSLSAITAAQAWADLIDKVMAEARRAAP